jgi:hypothetical protein
MGPIIGRLPTFEEQHGHPTEVKKEWFDQLARTIAIDFDGVLHPYTNGWTGSVPDDEPPISGVRGFLELLKAQDYRLVVFSTRADHAEGAAGIDRWLTDWGIRPFFDEITHTKPPAIAYVDDRAVPFIGNWQAVLDGIDKLAGGPSHGAAR